MMIDDVLPYWGIYYEYDQKRNSIIGAKISFLTAIKSTHIDIQAPQSHPHACAPTKNHTPIIHAHAFHNSHSSHDVAQNTTAITSSLYNVDNVSNIQRMCFSNKLWPPTIAQ